MVVNDRNRGQLKVGSVIIVTKQTLKTMKKLAIGLLSLGFMGYLINPAIAQASLPEEDECFTFTFKRVSENPMPCLGPGTDCPMTVCTEDWNP